MTDKEFKRLSRAQLIDIIYQLQLQMDKLAEQNRELERELEDKRLRLSNAGNIAEAALKINDCFNSAQRAAEQYLNQSDAGRNRSAAAEDSCGGPGEGGGNHCQRNQDTERLRFRNCGNFGRIRKEPFGNRG